MGIIKNRTTLNDEVLTLVANGAVGPMYSKKTSFEKTKDVEELTR